MEFRATFWLQSSGRRKEALLAHSDPQGLACKSWGSWCTYHSLPHIYEASTSTMWRLSRQSWPQAFTLLNFPLPQISNFMKWMNECLKKKKKGIPMFSSPSMQTYLWPADTRIPSLSLLSLPDWQSLFFFLKALLQLGLTYLFLSIFVLLISFSLIYFAFLWELVQSQGLFSVHPPHRWENKCPQCLTGKLWANLFFVCRCFLFGF